MDSMKKIIESESRRDFLKMTAATSLAASVVVMRVNGEDCGHPR
jgi:hypothetical protein